MRSKKWFLMLLLMLGLILSVSTLAAAQNNVSAANKSCLTCHQREGFTTKHNGKKISLAVDQSVLSNSVHKNNPCTTCHMDIQGFPHQDVVYGAKLAARVSKNCQMCHSDVAKNYKNSAHLHATKEGKANVGCSSCHGKHDIQRVELTKKEEVELCADCHQGEVLESYEESFHGKAVKLGSEKSASCVDCHGSHQALGPEAKASPVSEKNTPKTCAKCHDKPRKNFVKGKEHAAMKPEGPGAPMYYTLKFFTWLTILTIAFLIGHILMELVGKFRDAGQDSH